LNSSSILGSIRGDFFLDLDGNFSKLIELDIGERFAILVKQARFTLYNISGSPFLVKKMELAQGLNAYFSTTDYRKRKRLGDNSLPASKRRRI
jgi:hypothetical protein